MKTRHQLYQEMCDAESEEINAKEVAMEASRLALKAEHRASVARHAYYIYERF